MIAYFEEEQNSPLPIPKHVVSLWEGRVITLIAPNKDLLKDMIRALQMELQHFYGQGKVLHVFSMNPKAGRYAVTTNEHWTP